MNGSTTTNAGGLPTFEPASTRPVQGSVTYPFKLAKPGNDWDHNASTATLTNAQGVVSHKGSPNDINASGCLAMDDGKLVDASRPEPKTFVTANDGLATMRNLKQT